jgi:uncharacterized protein (TIGR02300 family)
MWQIAKNSLTTKGWLMATNKERGTKRTCQNGECGARFYDLNRSPILCPICGSKYAIAHSTTAAAAVAPPPPRKVKREEFVEPAAAAEAETEEALADVETDDTEEAAGTEADETFLEEEEEDGGDVSTIIGPVEGEEER